MATEYLDKGSDVGTVAGFDQTSLVGFYGVGPVDPADALSAAATAITFVSATCSLSITIQLISGTSAFGFTNSKEAQCFLKAIQNLQIRQAEVETALVACGLVAGGTQATSLDVNYVGSGNDDGETFGRDADSLIAFYGNAPVNQPDAFTTTALTISITATASQIAAGSGVVGTMSIDATCLGWTDHENGQTFLGVVSNLEDRMEDTNDRLVELGIIAGGTALTASDELDHLGGGNTGGLMLGRGTDSLLGFYGTTPVSQAAALTTAAITISAVLTSGCTDNAIASLASGAASFRIAGVTAVQTMLDAVQRLQQRAVEIETRLSTPGLIA